MRLAVWIEADDIYHVTFALEGLDVLTFLMKRSVTVSFKKRAAVAEPLLCLMQAKSEIAEALSSKDPTKLEEAIKKHEANLPESEVESAKAKLEELVQATCADVLSLSD